MSPIVKKIKKNKKNILKIVAVLLAVAALAFTITKLNSIGTETEVEEEEYDGVATIEYNGKTYKQRDSITTIMVIGIDKYLKDTYLPEDAYVNTQQADFDVVLILDSEDESYTLLQINRDCMVQVKHLGVNGEVVKTEIEQLALSHTYGNGGGDSCRNTVKSVKSLLFGTEIDQYIAFTMDAIPIVNDEVGGVTVYIEDDFSGVDASLVQGQEVTLMGDMSLSYIRARGGMKDSTNLTRMKRHRTYLKALLEAAREKMDESSSWAAKTVSKVQNYLTTDMTTKDLASLADLMVKYKQRDIQTIQGETVTTDHVEFYPDEDALKAQVIELFYEEVVE